MGLDLQKTIARLLDIRFKNGHEMTSGDGQIYEVFRREFPSEVGEYQKACWRIRDGLPLSSSIDNFMDKHHSDERIQLVGRLAIAKSILEAEHHSSLAVDHSRQNSDIHFDSVSGTWLTKLYVLMQDGLRKADVHEFFKSSAFIVFNYDRCVEHFFLYALVRDYGLTQEKAAEIVNGAKILHPYGTVGNLAWRTSDRPHVAFGSSDRPIREISPQIRTYTDQIEQPDMVDYIKAAVGEAEAICFLGFSFQRQNLDLISPLVVEKHKTLIASAFGISDFNATEIKNQIQSRFGGNNGSTHVDNSVKCAQLMDKYALAFRR